MLMFTLKAGKVRIWFRFKVTMFATFISKC